MGKTSPVAKTVRDYSEASTIHGISYVFSTSLPLVDKTLWALVTFTCLSLAAYWSATAYGNWQESLVVTTLKDPAKSVTSLPFPAVTICTSGIDMDAVKDKLMKDFNTWKEEEGRTSVNKEEDKAHLEEYMKVKFEIEDIKTKNIFDTIKALSSPDPAKTMQSLSVLERAIACNEEEENVGRDRKKRSTPTQIFPFQYGEEIFARIAVQSGNRMTRDVVEETCRNHGMRPFCRYNNRPDRDVNCAIGNLPRIWERVHNQHILSCMKCNCNYWKCSELVDIFFYLTDDLQSLPEGDVGQNEVSAMFGSSGVLNGSGGFDVEGARYISTDDRPLYAACVQEPGGFKSCSI